jgi:hypothetical protein
MTEMTEADKLALEEAAKQEGIKQAEQDAAIAKAAEDAEKARVIAEQTEFMSTYLNDRLGQVNSDIAALGEQVSILTATVDALIAEQIDEPDDKPDDKPDEKTEQQPPAVTEPKKRKRGWA